MLVSWRPCQPSPSWVGAAQYFREAHRVPLNPALAAGCCGKAQPILATSAQFKRSNVLGFQWCQRHVLFPLVKF